MRFRFYNLVLGTIFLLLIFIAFFSAKAFSLEKQKVLVDSIEQVCFNDSYSFNKKEQCILFFTNCTIQNSQKWKDKRLFECLKRWKKVQTQDKSVYKKIKNKQY